MDGNLISLVRAAERISSETLLDSPDRIIEFYEQAGLDYEHWSRGFNMHLGFYRRGLNPFDREAMLEEMNLEIAKRLELDANSESLLLDLGCGMGSIARSVARYYSRSSVKGITLVPTQVRMASELNARANLDGRIEILRGDYTRLAMADHSADGVWAVESACYAQGDDKADLVREMARVLKPGGRFVVADCFIKCPERELNPIVRRFYRMACDDWALVEMPAIEAVVVSLRRHGFRDVVVEDISWRVAPSLAHAPVAVLTFVVKKVLSGESFNRHSINNLRASLSAFMIGLNRSKFSYCVISGTRANDCYIESV